MREIIPFSLDQNNFLDGIFLLDIGIEGFTLGFAGRAFGYERKLEMANARKIEVGDNVLIRTGNRGKNTLGTVLKSNRREVRVLLGPHWGNNRERSIKPSEVLEMTPAEAKARYTKKER